MHTFDAHILYQHIFYAFAFGTDLCLKVKLVKMKKQLLKKLRI